MLPAIPDCDGGESEIEGAARLQTGAGTVTTYTALPMPTFVGAEVGVARRLKTKFPAASPRIETACTATDAVAPGASETWLAAAVAEMPLGACVESWIVEEPHPDESKFVTAA